MNELNSSLAGFVVASFVPPMLLAISFPLSGHVDLGSVAGTFLVLLPFSGMFVIGLGVPAFLLLRKFAPGHWWSVFAAGFLLGDLTSLIVASHFQERAMLVWGAIGGITAIVFWLIWLQGRKSATR